ncbi:hypothetical protein DEO72_LG3g2774 [Vigna unguiculata]|uniref:Epidermal patterning factor-like protein n=2 Tax=Vigna unguiculata TaxID=3917 RepID=A0A4D6LIR4_VIGUN|nr:hypothetical protein DEO72_LG3g2768 [Vigna unguiculata]QCD88232.1 hypothetical protein DEO72_LG3g2774 [Vigna unguiculata]
MDTVAKQSRVCRNVFFLFLFCTLIFSSRAASTKDSKIGESLVSLTGGAESLIGSTPPSCNSRCGNCTPCTPVAVPFTPPAQPQTDSVSDQPDPASHRPEAEVWKCSCGGKLYDP